MHYHRCLTVGYGVTANIAASHAAARGSTPRIRVLFADMVQSFGGPGESESKAFSSLQRMVPELGARVELSGNLYMGPQASYNLDLSLSEINDSHG